MKKIILLCLAMCLVLTTSCSKPQQLEGTTPTVLTLWHYYNGNTKVMFDKLVEDFNNNEGLQAGIIIDAYSQGDVNQLAERVLRSAAEEVGSDPMPDIFAAYSDNAYRVDTFGKVATLDAYFTAEELAQFRKEFIDDGRFSSDNSLKIFPVAKSSENLFLNSTDFDKFAEATGASKDKLATWEGICSLAAEYYQWSDNQTPELNDGKAMLGIDSMANFMLISSMQLGEEFYAINNGSGHIQISKENVRVMWDNFYVPFVKGHFGAMGRFRSDDAKTGDILAYVGSTASAGYFPQKVEINKDQSYEISCEVYAYPYYEGKKPYCVQQGAGMTISKTTTQREAAAVTFLKWLTQEEQNEKFASATGYLPVKNASLEDLNKSVSAETENQAAVVASARASEAMLKTHTLYGNKPFLGSYEVRKILESSMANLAKQDRQNVKTALAEGANLEEALKSYLAEECFENWYETFIADIEKVLAN